MMHEMIDQEALAVLDYLFADLGLSPHTSPASSSRLSHPSFAD